MRNISHKIVQKIKTHILYTISFSENYAVYDIQWTLDLRT
jgi:hypothetical protein